MRPLIRILSLPLAILVAGQNTLLQAQTVTVNFPATVTTYSNTVNNVQITQDLSLGSSTALDTSTPKPAVTASPITVAPYASGGTKGACAIPIPANRIIQDCALGNSSFESNMVNLWLALHGQPASEAALVYQYGGLELRSEIRSFMWSYLEGVIGMDPSQRTGSDQQLYNWLVSAIQANEIQYYQAAVAEYNRWLSNKCTFRLNSTIATSLKLSYDALPYCTVVGDYFTPPPVPNSSYFLQVGQVAAYDSKISTYDQPFMNAALTGAQFLVATERDAATWSSIASLGAGLAFATSAAGVVAQNLNSIAPFVNRRALKRDVNVGDEAESVAEEEAASDAEAAELEVETDVETGVEIGSAGADVLGAATIVLIFVQIAAEAAINLSDDINNQNSIDAMVATSKTIATQTPDLYTMLHDSVGYQKIIETFVAATLPDFGQLQDPPALPGPSYDLASYSVYITDHTSNNQVSVNNFFNYTTWDPKFPPYPGNPPYEKYGTSINAYPYKWGFVQTVSQGNLHYSFFSPTIRYIDPNSGMRYTATLIDKGRFLVTKAPDLVDHHDIDCPANPITGLTQTPNTQIPSACRSFVMNTLNIYANDFYNTTVQLPQAPVFVTPSAANFSTNGSTRSFVPLLDSSSQGLPCSIRATGVMPPGFTFSNGALYVNVPSATSGGTYQISFVANCETLGLGTPFVNYGFGSAITTQQFTVNVVPGPTSGSAISMTRTVGRKDSSLAASAATPLQFLYPTPATNLKFTLGRQTTLTVETNGGNGTSITAGANALPPGLTLVDNHNGTATISGIPTGPAPSCTTGCAITASYPGVADATLILSATVAPPTLPSIPVSQAVSWNAGEPNYFNLDASIDNNGKPVQVPLTWSAAGTFPSWATVTSNGNNTVGISGIPPVSLAGQTLPLQFQYTYPGGQSSAFTLNVTVGQPTSFLVVTSPFLFSQGVSGSGALSAVTLSGTPGLNGVWRVNATLPAGLTATPNGTSLTISGTPTYPGMSRIPIQFTDTAGHTTRRTVPLMVTQPASLANFPSRLVLFTGVPTHTTLRTSGGYPAYPSNGPGDGLPSTTGTNLQLSSPFSATNGLSVESNGLALLIRGTPQTPATYSLTVSAQTVLSTGPVGSKVSQPFTLYVRAAGDVNLDGAVDCVDYTLVKSHLGAFRGQTNYLDLADPNGDGVVNILDLAFVQSHLPKGTTCH